MALGECGKVLALLSLAAGLLLLADALPSSRLLRGGPAVADLLHAALGRVSLLDLATRRNMVLLCHAILLVLLGDAGILGVPARRRQCQGRESAASACYSDSPTEPWRMPAATNLPLTEAERGLQVVAEDRVSANKDIVLPLQVEMKRKQGTDTDLDHRHLVPIDQPASASVDDMLAYPYYPMMTDSAGAAATDKEEEEPAAADDQHGGEEEEAEEEEDLDEMNRRFDAFIAATKEKMRLEALHPAPQDNRALVSYRHH